MKLKVCGMREPGNIQEIALLKPDYMGFIFYPRSRRYVGEEFDVSAMTAVPAGKRVGVFVNESIPEIARKVNKYELGLVQLHGDESPADIEQLKNSVPGIRIIKAFGMDGKFGFRSLEPYKPLCDFFLFDTKVAEYGGSGKTFDWRLLDGYDNEIPFFLSGGIGAEELKDLPNLTQRYHIHAIDINSKAETAPGIKDALLVKGVRDIVSAA
jgi:phosphoribosylanthranilate isomerase